MRPWHDDITRRHWEQVRRLLARKVSLWHDSEDLAQLTLLTAGRCRATNVRPAANSGCQTMAPNMANVARAEHRPSTSGRVAACPLPSGGA